MTVTLCLNELTYCQAVPNIGTAVKQLPTGQANFKGKPPH